MNEYSTMLFQKLASTPTTAARAVQIRNLTGPLKIARDTVREEFTDKLLPQFCEVDEKGKPKRDAEGDFVTLPDKADELAKAQEEFGDKEYALALDRPIPLDAFTDIKMTAADMEWLDGLITTDMGPGLPPGALRKV